MNNNCIITAFFLLLLTPLKAQTDYFPSKRPEITQEVYDKYIDRLKSIYEQETNGKGRSRYNVALCFAHLGESADKVYNELELLKAEALKTSKGQEWICSMVKPLLIWDKRGNAPIFKKIDEDRWNRFCLGCDAMLKKMEEELYEIDLQYDQGLISVMKAITKEDQETRAEIAKATRLLGRNAEIVENLWRKQNYLDSLNLLKIDSLFDKYKSYVGKDLVGPNYSSTCMFVIHHSSNYSKFSSYFDLLKEAVKTRQLEKHDFRFYLDRFLIRAGQKQLFRSQEIWNTASNKLELAPNELAEDIKKKLIELKLTDLDLY